MTEIDRRPPIQSVVGVAMGGLLSVAAIGIGSPEGAAVGVAGLLAFVVGLLRSSSRALTWGAGLVAVGIVIGGLAGAGAGGLVVAAVALAVTWDIADHALSIGDHVGRRARSSRNQFFHAGASLLVGLLTAGIAYGSYAAATGGQPVAALVFMLFGVVVLVSAFR